MTGQSGNPSSAVDSERALGFAPDDDVPIAYIKRTHDWYDRLGYGNPYRYAHYVDVPFQPLSRRLEDSTFTLITTAAPFQADKGPQGPGAPYNAAAKFFEPYSGDTALDHDLRVSHVGIDRRHTSMEDSNVWFPLPLMRQFAREGRIGRLARRFHGAPTNRSQRHTLETDIPKIITACKEDAVDVAILVPNCPVCHQTLSLAARELEREGIATVIMGCAKDIVEHVGVPRFLFSDFPLGNGAGKPHDAASQRTTLDLALKVLTGAPGARTTVQSPIRWAQSHEWKLDYSNVDRLSAEDVARLRAESDQAKATAKAIQRAAGPTPSLRS